MGRPENDHELMLRVRNDEADALAELMRRYEDRLIRFFTSLCGDAALAEDLFQETFIRLWKARKRYVPLAAFSTYLIEIAKNLWLNEKPRWQRRRDLLALEDEPEEEQPRALQVAETDRRSLPEAAMLQRECERRIAATVESLPPHLGIVFTLSHFEGCKYREIAGMLGIAEGTVKWRMFEATRRLRELLHEDGEGAI